MGQGVHYVYQLRVDGTAHPFYIGKGREGRAYHHLSGREGNNEHKNNTIRKARREGREVLVEFLWENLSEEESLRREVWAIALWGRSDRGQGPLTNLTDGGEGISGAINTWSLRGKDHPMYGAGHLQRGELNHMYGKSGVLHHACGTHHSEETKAKMRAAWSARKSEGWEYKPRPPVSEETRKKISDSRLGQKLSEETVEKIRTKNIGQVRSKETRDRISSALRGKPTGATAWSRPGFKERPKLVAVWLFAPELLRIWEENGRPKHVAFCKYVGLKASDNVNTFQTLIPKFENGWNPENDEDFMCWRASLSLEEYRGELWPTTI